MANPIVKVYERLTRKPYYTGRSMVADFGPPPAVRRAQAKSARPVPTSAKRAEVAR